MPCVSPGSMAGMKWLFIGDIALAAAFVLALVFYLALVIGLFR